MLLAWLILCLVGVVVAAPTPAVVSLTLTCQSHSDLHELVYSICVADTVCAFVYGIDGHHQHRHNHFWHQMRVFDIYGPFANQYLSQGRWPANITVLYNASVPVSCYNLTNFTADEQSLFNYVTLDRLKTHEQFFSYQVCAHRNERLLFNNVTLRFYCYCPEDKDCSGFSSHESTVTILYGLTLGFFALLVAVMFPLGLRVAAK